MRNTILTSIIRNPYALEKAHDNGSIEQGEAEDTRKWKHKFEDTREWKHEAESYKAKEAESTYSINMPQGPITRSRSKRLQQAFNLYLQARVNSASEGLQGNLGFNSSVAKVQYNVIQVQILCNGLGVT